MIIAYVTVIICAIPASVVLLSAFAEAQKGRNGNLKRTAWNMLIFVVLIGVVIVVSYLTDDKNFAHNPDTENGTAEEATEYIDEEE
jgi:NADH:ubiquinone oxidoreductase subunit 6 (subunit J)